MTKKTVFKGSFVELKEKIQSLGYIGQWDDNPDKTCFRAQSGEILNWFPSTGTVQFQGSSVSQFKENFSGEILYNPRSAELVNEIEKKPTKIFIVHGHDKEALGQLELVLMKLGLDPFILQNENSGSKTLIEALEQRIYSESAFGIVLMTPDDFGYSKKLEDKDRQPRARQNVILEMGMIMAALGRDKVAIFKKGNLEMPSDTEGMIRLDYNDRVQEQVAKLVQHLEEAGIEIDHRKVAGAST